MKPAVPTSWFKKLFDKYRKEIIGSRLLIVEGRLKREGEVVHLIVRRCYNQSGLLLSMTSVETGHYSSNVVPF